MSNPIIAQKIPYILTLDPGEYMWCACGRSANQPFCDGSHSGTEFTPVSFSVEKKSTLTLCGCKHSLDVPFCDGSHNSL